MGFPLREVHYEMAQCRHVGGRPCCPWFLCGEGAAALEASGHDGPNAGEDEIVSPGNSVADRCDFSENLVDEWA
jgi:hypothetical protein